MMTSTSNFSMAQKQFYFDSRLLLFNDDQQKQTTNFYLFCNSSHWLDNSKYFFSVPSQETSSFIFEKGRSIPGPISLPPPRIVFPGFSIKKTIFTHMSGVYFGLSLTSSICSTEQPFAHLHQCFLIIYCQFGMDSLIL
jgi:hypothetical protein